VLGTPRYARTLTVGFVVIAIGFAVGINAVLSAAPSDSTGLTVVNGTLVLGIVILGGCLVATIFGISSLRAHLVAKRRQAAQAQEGGHGQPK
jgi:hypothetical protein